MRRSSALFATVAIAASASPAPAATWSPGAPLADAKGGAVGVQAGIDGRGRAVVAWHDDAGLHLSRCIDGRGCARRTALPAVDSHHLRVTQDGTAYLLTARARTGVVIRRGTTAGRFGSARALASRAVDNEFAARLAVAPDGPAAAAWTRPGGGVSFARVDRAARPIRITAKGELRAVAVNSRGDALLAWEQDVGGDRGRLQARLVSARGALGRVIAVSDTHDLSNDESIVEASAVLADAGEAGLAWIYDFPGLGGPEGIDGAHVEAVAARFDPHKARRAHPVFLASGDGDIALWRSGRGFRVAWDDSDIDTYEAFVTVADLGSESAANQQVIGSGYAPVAADGAAGDAGLAWLDGSSPVAVYEQAGSGALGQRETIARGTPNRRNRVLLDAALALGPGGSGRALLVWGAGHEGADGYNVTPFVRYSWRRP